MVNEELESPFASVVSLNRESLVKPGNQKTNSVISTSGFVDPLMGIVGESGTSDGNQNDDNTIEDGGAVDDNKEHINVSGPPDSYTQNNNSSTGNSIDNINSAMPLKNVDPAAVYSFDVSVSDPQKIGSDLINAHVVYRVKTKTNSPAFRNAEFSVNRRFRDFLWLYNQLQEQFPGVIIPPVPEKHAIGRFQNEFVETRRIALERCLRKITSHPLLQNEKDVRMFLESETFSVDVNQKKKEESRSSFMSVFSLSSTNTTFSKILDDDEFFVKRRAQIDVVDNQLRLLAKAVEGLIKQRRDLAAAVQDFGESVMVLGTVEVNKPAAQSATNLGKIQLRIKELYEQQAKHDLCHILGVVDEHVRIVGSIKLAFASRLKVYSNWQNAESAWLKKKESIDKIRASAKIRLDKISLGEAEMAALEKASKMAKKEFDEVSELLKGELVRQDKEKVGDFAAGIQDMLRGMVETQKEIVSTWETFFK